MKVRVNGDEQNANVTDINISFGYDRSHARGNELF